MDKKPQISKELRDYFAEIGRKGGAIGGHVRGQRLSTERKREIALMGVAARKAKRKA